jgi:hypothetical protein
MRTSRNSFRTRTQVIPKILAFSTGHAGSLFVGWGESSEAHRRFATAQLVSLRSTHATAF